MTDQERITELEKRLESLEKAVLAIAMGKPFGLNKDGKIVDLSERKMAAPPPGG